MNYTQNEKDEQVTDITKVVGVDIGSKTHYARVLYNCECELTKSVFLFRMTLKDSISSIFAWKH